MNTDKKARLLARLESLQIYLDDITKVSDGVKRIHTPAEKCAYELSLVIKDIIDEFEVAE